MGSMTREKWDAWVVERAAEIVQNRPDVQHRRIFEGGTRQVVREMEECVHWMRKNIEQIAAELNNVVQAALSNCPFPLDVSPPEYKPEDVAFKNDYKPGEACQWPTTLAEFAAKLNTYTDKEWAARYALKFFRHLIVEVTTSQHRSWPVALATEALHAKLDALESTQ